MNARIMACGACAAWLALACPLQASSPVTAPADPVTVAVGGQSVTLWPYTSDDLAAPSDPINLVFLNADPRELRQALLALDGNRTAFGFPATAPFDCTWRDGMGNEQAAWAENEGWVGGAIQLTCGPESLGPLRFHLRLFRQGALTLGGTHFELQIPGTAEHQVLHWELAEAFVKADLARSGVLRAPPTAVALTAPGPFRSIPNYIYNPMLADPRMAALLALLGLPLTPQPGPVPIPSDGQATVFAPGIVFEPVQQQLRTELTVVYNRVAFRPFCASGPADLVYLQGPLRFVIDTHTNPSGAYHRAYTIAGTLTVTPIDPATGSPTGPPLPALISETHHASLTDHHGQITEIGLQSLLGQPVQLKAWRINAGQSDRYSKTVDCGPLAP